jgi:hypothetical protein
MGGLRREDYVLRQIRGIAAMLARIAGLRLSGNSEEARAELEKSYALLLGTQGELLRRVDSHSAARLLGTPERVLALAQLLREEAEQEGDPARRASLTLRAAELGIEAARRDPESEVVRQFLRELSPGVDRERLAAEDRAALEESMAESQKPDFSGTWQFNPARSVLQIPPPDSTVFVIDHREPLFRITRTHVVGDKSDTFTLDLTTDGKEVALDREGLHLRARAYWDGATLVFDSKLTRGGVEGTNIVRYALAKDALSFTAEERFRSAARSYDNLWVLDRT